MKKIFTVLLIGVLILSAWQKCEAQTTWVKTYNIDFPASSLHFDSATVGPQEMCVTPNGTIITLMQVNQGHDTWLMALDSLGNVIWQKFAAHHGGIYREDCFSLHATADNGCVYFFRHDGSSIVDSVLRMLPNGGVKWSKTFHPMSSSPIMQDLVESIVPTNYNTYYLQFKDSLVELGGNGSYFRSRVPFSYTSKIIAVPDSDIIRADSSIIYKEDFNGTQRWSLSAPGYYLVSANMSFIYARSGNQVMKINTSSGSVIWTKYINTSAMALTSDNGFIAINSNQIAKYDSSGTVEWSKSILLPYLGLRGVVETPSKTYVTGGTWKSFDLYYISSIGFSPLLLKIDSLGNGVVDSTDYFFNGNANDNTALSFGDDAVYIAAAMNNAGTKRDSLVRNRSVGKNVFASDWSGRYATGLNFKYSDIDGNGIVDTNDISLFSNSYPFFNHSFPITPHWPKLSNPINVPDLSFSFENDSVNYSDTIKVRVILGSTSLAIDSIYGLSFDLILGNIHIMSSPPTFNISYSIKPNSLGDTSLNLYSFMSFNQSGLPLMTSMVLCRTDHMNAYVAGDTLVTLYYVLPNDVYFQNPVSMNVQWSAITEAGFPISLNLITDTLYLSGTTGINRYDNKDFSLFPNPATDQILFSFNTENTGELTIMDETGRNILSIKNPGNKYLLNVREFADGIYYATTVSENKVSRAKFLVVH